MSIKLSSNMEDYLETVHVLTLRNGNVRVKDIAREMGKTMPSVSAAMKKMEKRGFVCHPLYDLVGLTAEGALLAEKIYSRHRLIRDFLADVLGVDAACAETDACHIEHVVSDQTLAGFSRLLDEARYHSGHLSGDKR
ncbi:metal-dependent transcriptional regulator [bacterium]|nr:metal-dependent transcriptional regulator [bacterium]